MERRCVCRVRESEGVCICASVRMCVYTNVYVHVGARVCVRACMCFKQMCAHLHMQGISVPLTPGCK